MIPNRLHQIWLGPRPAPIAWVETWHHLNPDFEHRLWDGPAIDGLGLENERLFRRYLAAGIYDGAADVARVEILHRSGGVYADADSVALRPLREAPFLEAGFFAQYEASQRRAHLITNAFMGATAGHSVLRRYIDRLSRVRELRPMWRLTGPGALTDVLEERSDADVMVLPPWTFFTHSPDGKELSGGGESYARHFWSTTAERWGHEGTTPYPDDGGVP